MILQSLNQLYHRLKDEEDYELPSPGYSVQQVTFRIILNPDGSLVDIQDARQTLTETTKAGKTKTKQVPKPMRLLGESKPPGQGINPCYFWDNSSYLLGYKKPDKNPTKAEKEAARSLECLAATKEHYLTLAKEIPELAPIAKFYQNHWSPELAENWKDKLDDYASTGFGVFKVLPSKKDFHLTPAICEWWQGRLASIGSNSSAPSATCLITGKQSPIARLHDPAIKGVNGAAPGGAKLASFNLDPFESYAKDQSFNAPVSEDAVFAYCNALNALLSGPLSSRHRITIGDVTTVFWTERKTVTESIFASLFDGKIEAVEEPKVSEDQTLQNQLHALLDTLRKGGGASFDELEDDPNTKFYILGLSGNVTRLVVRFWHVGTIAEILSRLSDHYQDLALACKTDRHPFYEPEFPSAQRLLDQTARERKAISPILGGQLMQAILHGTAYPTTLLNGVINRIRANDPVDYLKAAILKAILNRNHLTNPTDKKMTEAIDPTRTEPAYHLGRLFAVYETAQRSAQPGINRTIRETMYSSASATPLAVFGRLERLHHHHTAKKSHPYGSSDSYANIVADIQQNFKGGPNPYPSTLNITEQSLFAVGYYHQLQHFRDLAEAKKGTTSQP